MKTIVKLMILLGLPVALACGSNEPSLGEGMGGTEERASSTMSGEETPLSFDEMTGRMNSISGSLSNMMEAAPEGEMGGPQMSGAMTQMNRMADSMEQSVRSMRAVLETGQGESPPLYEQLQQVQTSMSSMVLSFESMVGIMGQLRGDSGQLQGDSGMDKHMSEMEKQDMDGGHEQPMSFEGMHQYMATVSGKASKMLEETKGEGTNIREMTSSVAKMADCMDQLAGSMQTLMNTAQVQEERYVEQREQVRTDMNSMVRDLDSMIDEVERVE